VQPYVLGYLAHGVSLAYVAGAAVKITSVRGDMARVVRVAESSRAVISSCRNALRAVGIPPPACLVPSLPVPAKPDAVSLPTGSFGMPCPAAGQDLVFNGRDSPAQGGEVPLRNSAPGRFRASTRRESGRVAMVAMLPRCRRGLCPHLRRGCGQESPRVQGRAGPPMEPFPHPRDRSSGGRASEACLRAEHSSVMSNA